LARRTRYRIFNRIKQSSQDGILIETCNSVIL